MEATKVTGRDSGRSPGAPGKVRGAWSQHKKKRKVTSKTPALGTGVVGKERKWQEGSQCTSVSSVPGCP